MEAKEFVIKLRERVIENDFNVYRDLLDPNIEATDPIWDGILRIYNTINKKQQEDLLKFLRLTQVNTLSHVLGILDGPINLSESNVNFILITDKENKAINGDLQDIFLEMEES